MNSERHPSLDSTLPVAIIGAGPIGLAAAAHLWGRGIDFVLLERGHQAGANLLEWAHVRMFSPWKYNLDEVSARLLAGTGWVRPDPESFPTGGDLHDQLVAPLAATPEIAPRIRYRTEVVAVSRLEKDRQRTQGRAEAPFVLRLRTDEGHEDEIMARAVIDASGTWTGPKPLGAHGLPAIGEQEAAERIAYRVPDLLGTDRARYAGRSIAVVGGGDSAFNALAALDSLAAAAPNTVVHWILRGAAPGYGGGKADQLPARGALGLAVQRLVERGRIQIHDGFAIARVDVEPNGVTLSSRERTLGPFDEIICVTGYRPDHEMLKELRLGLDPITEAPTALGPLIDPNLHSCGTVPPHSYRELAHPEEGFFMVGMKSYGRAPTFLLLTGYEQVRSVVAALAQDWTAAGEVELVLPETGVCSSGLPPQPDADLVVASCCGSTGVEQAGVDSTSVIPEPVTELVVATCCGSEGVEQPGVDSTSAIPEPIPEPVATICCGSSGLDRVSPDRQPAVATVSVAAVTESFE